MINQILTQTVQPERVAIPPGATLGVFVDTIANQIAVTAKYFSGSSLVYIMGATGTLGNTMSAGDLGVNFDAGLAYQFTALDPIRLEGPTRFYLAATGATAVIQLLRERSAGQ